MRSSSSPALSILASWVGRILRGLVTPNPSSITRPRKILIVRRGRERERERDGALSFLEMRVREKGRAEQVSAGAEYGVLFVGAVRATLTCCRRCEGAEDEKCFNLCMIDLKSVSLWVACTCSNGVVLRS